MFLCKRSRSPALAVLSVALLCVSCGKGADSAKPAGQMSAAASTAATSTMSNAAKAGDVNGNGVPDSSDDEWPGTMTVRYEEATSPDAVRGRGLLEQNQLLENLADDVNQSLKLPYDVPLIGTQCDVANAFWDSEGKSMTICYEDAADALDIFNAAGDPDPVDSALNVEIATFLHETGHMVIDLYDLPVTGREEDVADQLAAFMLLAPGPDGKIDEGSVKAVKDFAREFGVYGQRNGAEITSGQLADVHSLDEARMYNLECWVYGADPVGNADLVNEGALPADRADGCEDEYQKLNNAWVTLLEPYVK